MVEQTRGQERRPRTDASEAISPELILVSPPEVASRARERLPQPSPFAPATPRQTIGVEERPRRRSTLPQIVVAVLALLFVAGTAAAVVRQNGANATTAQQIAQTGRVLAASTAAKLLGPTSAPHTRAQGGAAAHRSPRARGTPRVRSATKKSAAPATAARVRREPPTAFRKSGRFRASGATRFVPARVFTWPARSNASAYVVRFFRNGRRVLTLHAGRPRVTLPASFRFTRGSYRWQVLPVVAGHLRAPIVDSTFVLRPR